jgi:hypothetical protein
MLRLDRCAALLVGNPHTIWGKLCESLPFQRPPCSVTEDNAFRVAIQYAYVAWTEQVAKAAEKC